MTKDYDDMVLDFNASNAEEKLQFAIKWSLIKWRSIKDGEQIWLMGEDCGFCFIYESCFDCPLDAHIVGLCVPFMAGHSYEEIVESLRCLYVSKFGECNEK